MKKATIATCAAVVLATGASLAIAAKDGPFATEIKARKGIMQVYKLNLGQLAAMAKGKAPYDAKAATRAANNLNLAAQMDNSAMWPQGSDLTNADLKVKTTAKKEAWTTWPKIGEKQQAFVKAAAALADVAGGGVDGLKKAVGGVGKSCKGCHDDYRQKQS